MWPLLVFCTSALCTSVAADGDLPQVNTSKGPVQGVTISSKWTNKSFYAFRGIPYASPPVGNLRFKDPVPAEPWEDVLDATKDAASCMQFSSTSLKTSEDCLFLNVYTPELTPKEGLMPVMAWVHGGGFSMGSGSNLLFGPDFLVAEGVVVVTLNYRLGALGFLTLGSPEAPGNMGLKDQRLALKWVQQEIEKFGGNPNNVTLLGESAGSASVHLQYLSPLSKGLFHRVIGESGTALNWAVREDAPSFAMQLAAKLNCSQTSPPALLKCLQEVPAEQILALQSTVQASPQDVRKSYVLVWTATVDGRWSPEPFLPATPNDLAQQGVGSHVPFIMGINSEDGTLMMMLAESEIAHITNHLEDLIPYTVRKSSTDKQIKQLTERIKNFYFTNSSLAMDVREFVHMYTDVMFGYPTAISAQLFRNRADVYLYYFSFNGAFKEEAANDYKVKYNFTGVYHSEGLSYLFVRQEINQSAADDSREMVTWRRKVSLWTNFAKYGTPTVYPDPLLGGVSWSPVGKVSTRFLHIDDHFTMNCSDFLQDSVALWDSVSASRSAATPTATSLLAALNHVLGTVLTSVGNVAKEIIPRRYYQL